MLLAEQRKIIVLHARRKAFGSRLKPTAGVFELCTIHPEVFAAGLFLQIELHACFFHKQLRKRVYRDICLTAEVIRAAGQIHSLQGLLCNLALMLL